MLEQLKKFWNGLAKNAQYALMGGVAFIAVATVAMFIWLLSSSYQVLFTDLSTQDAGTIMGELERMKIDYKLADNGSKILIKDSGIHETRIKLMGKPLAFSGGIGFEVFDKADIGMTEYAQKVNFQRALQGELARTIMSINKIKTARVHLVLPETSIFKRDKSKPKASISLVVSPGRPLTLTQIVGIQRLVAAAVQSLEPSMVTIADQRGVTLSQPIGNKTQMAGIAGQLDLKQNIENHLTRKAMAVLDKTFGPGKAIISVDVSINFDQIKSTTQDILPVHGSKDVYTGVVVKKRYTVQKSPKHIVNAKTASVSPNTAVSYATNGGRSNITSEVEYKVGTKIQEIITTPGGIRRISIGVLVPRDLSEEKLKNIKEIVAMAVGINAQRGDAIAVQAITQFAASNQGLSDKTASDATAMTDGVGKNGQASTSAWTSKTGEFTDALLAKISSYTMQYPIFTIVLICFVGLLLISVLLRIVRSFKLSKPSREDISLSENEREQLLKQIQEWLASGKVLQERGSHS